MNPRYHVVIVHDDRLQLKRLSWALKRGGYEVQRYRRGADLIADLPETRVDLFVLDLHLPEIDGQPLCRLLRSPELSGFNETPILVVSATSPGVDAEGITSDLGADGPRIVDLPRRSDPNFRAIPTKREFGSLPCSAIR